MHMALGAFFSAMEVIPLVLLTFEAWRFMRLGAAARSISGTASAAFPHKWAVMFLIAVGFWNFLGAGVFGFLINLPIVSYYEIGTAFTANHAHGAMMGVYGMLAIGLLVFCLRYFIAREGAGSDARPKISFWSLNIGLAWMVFANLFPMGMLQLYDSVGSATGTPAALSFLGDTANKVLEWLRLPGDVLFIVGGALPLLWLAWKAITGGKKAQPDTGDLDLFTEVVEAS